MGRETQGQPGQWGSDLVERFINFCDMNEFLNGALLLVLAKTLPKDVGITETTARFSFITCAVLENSIVGRLCEIYKYR